ncbi:FmdB family zinc ribbon protein [Thioalkalivibrio sp. ALJ7]|uniref:FmdB family zinc ribbon protein n=1 Tax=Thioalkalivibrio sp. ALJ7 TaxID=1158756 RepID=UPI0003636A30|nr:zinc ribbon domain-containing protein [Thioalkalivibrio sp. ALJ7]
MPIYEYQCKQCGELSEILQKVSDPPATTCPACGAEALTKQVSAAGFRLAGGGWYETDFKKDGKRNLKEGSSSSGTRSSGGSSTKAESTGKSGSSGSAKTGTAATGT